MDTIKKILWLLFFSLALGRSWADSTPSIIATYRMSVYDETINDIYAKLNKTQNIDQRIDLISAYFLGKPYLLGALGEGPHGEFDKNPLYRTDAFDCVTFVTTVLALALSNNLQEFQHKIKAIRYLNNQPDFFNSHRFISIDWNIDNQRKGFIKDITNKFPAEEKTSTMLINRPAWYRKLQAATIKTFIALSPQDEKTLLDDIHQRGDMLRPVLSNLKYLPLTELFTRSPSGEIIPNMAVFDKIPNGAIIEIVYSRWDLSKKIGTSLNIAHMGFAIRSSEALIFRNASSVQGKVVDVPLIDYLANSFQILKHPSTKGIHIEVALEEN